MAAFNAVIGTQTAHWSGNTFSPIRPTTSSWPNMGAIDKTVYTAVVTGGVSGSFGVNAIGHVGGTTFYLAGVSAVTAAGKYVLFPFGYTHFGTGAIIHLGGNLNRIDNVIPASQISYEAVNAAGISALVTVSAAVWSR